MVKNKNARLLKFSVSILKKLGIDISGMSPTECILKAKEISDKITEQIYKDEPKEKKSKK